MTDFLLILLLILANSIFAMSEIAIVSAKESRLEPLARAGNRAARATLKLINSPTRFLATIQIGSTLIGILAGALSGAALVDRVDPIVAQVGWLEPYSRPISFAVTVGLITYLTLVIGELVPKRMALNNPERIAMQMARPIQFLSLLGLPLIRVLTLSTEGILRLLRVTTIKGPPVTEEELKLLLAQGAKAGVFEQAEHQLVRRALDLDDRRITSVMTPRRDIIGLDINDSIEEIQAKVIDSGFARLPVFDGDADHVVGIVRTPQLLVQYARGHQVALTEYLYKAVFIPGTASPAQVLELFRQTQMHTVLVVDEYGGVMGLVTPTDILEFIVGQLPSIESEELPADIVQREDGSWLVDGLISIEDLASALPNGETFIQDNRRIQTLNGLVMEQLTRIPITGDTFTWSGFHFEVVDMDGNRVDKVLISQIIDESQSPPDEETDESAW
jgi:putative hemolysin